MKTPLLRIFYHCFGICAVALVLSSCSILKSEKDWKLAKFDDNYRASEVSTESPLSLNGVKGFLSRGYSEKRMGLYLLEPFDPKKVPVLFIHGLVSEPDTWRDMVDVLRADPEIVKRYQFWFYAYPSATPIVPSAAMLRIHLDRAIHSVEKDFDVSMDRRLIVVGHSMGGILTKALVSSSGDRLWDSAFKAPVDKFDLTPRQKTLLSNAFRYEPRPYVGAAIFIASPHRGSYLANSLIGRIGARLSSRPAAIDSLADALVMKNNHLLQPNFSIFVADNVNAISTLRPNSPITNLLADFPVDSGVTYHTLAGVKGGNSKKKPEGDGVVPLTSTVVPGARCETGIHSGHNVHQTEEAYTIVSMLLRLEAGLVTESQIRDNLDKMNLPFARYKGR